MKRLSLFPFSMLILLGWDSARAAGLPTRLVVELTDVASRQVLETGTLPEELDRAITVAFTLEPIFYLPVNPGYRERWYRHGLNRWFRVNCNDTAPEEIARQLDGVQDILSVELHSPVAPFSTPNDYSLRNLWGLDRMRLPDAWDIHHGESEILVATLDSGCDIYHPDLARNQWVNPGEDLNHNGIWDQTDNNNIDDDGNGFLDDLTGWDFVSATPDIFPDWIHPLVDEDYGPRDNHAYPDVVGHGTHVAGIAAAVTNNEIGVASASWNVRHLPLRFMFAYLDNDGNLNTTSYLDDAAPAIQYAAENGARVLNMSWGDANDYASLRHALSYARDFSVLLVAAAGNTGTTERNYPAAYANVLAVSSTDPLDHKSTFASYGGWIDFCAPGQNIMSTFSNNRFHEYDYTYQNGTSMSSPFIAAIAGLLLNYNPDFTATDLEIILRSTCDNIDDLNPTYAWQLGYGRVNAYQAIQMAQDLSVEPGNNLPIKHEILSIYPNPFNSTAVVEVSLNSSEFFKLYMYNLLGELTVTLAEGRFSPGVHLFHLNQTGFATGSYFIRAEFDDGSEETKKAVVIK